jgi:hypothetical protein
MVMGPRGLGGAGFYPSKQVLQPLIEGLKRFCGFIQNFNHGMETADERRWTLMKIDRMNYNQNILFTHLYLRSSVSICGSLLSQVFEAIKFPLNKLSSRLL